MFVYLDNNATTRPDPKVLEALSYYYKEEWGNPASLHRFGAQTREAVERARKQVMLAIGATRPAEILFTSGGTESNHLAILGTLAASQQKKHCITTAVEHSSVLKLFQRLEKEGTPVDFLSVNAKGQISLQELESKITPETALVSIVWANNETGVIFPITEAAKICARHHVPLHVDAIQAFGKIPMDVYRTGVDLVSLSGHKFHAPKGVGCLYVKKGHRLRPMFLGGSQEQGMRAGTSNVPGIVGFGAAAEIAMQNLSTMEKVKNLRDQLEQKILKLYSKTILSGIGSPRLPNTSHICFDGLDGESICLLLSEVNVCASTGSACSAGSLESSHVLKAMGMTPQQAKGAVRFSLSRETTDAEMEQTAIELGKIVKRLSQ